MATGLLPLQPMQAAAVSWTPVAGTVFGSNVYHVTADATIFGANATASTDAVPAISVPAGVQAVLRIDPGVTLEVNGGNGFGQRPGAPGIHLPLGSTLTVTGGGTLRAIGGNGGNGVNGQGAVTRSATLYSAGFRRPNPPHVSPDTFDFDNRVPVIGSILDEIQVEIAGMLNAAGTGISATFSRDAEALLMSAVDNIRDGGNGGAGGGGPGAGIGTFGGAGGAGGVGDTWAQHRDLSVRGGRQGSPAVQDFGELYIISPTTVLQHAGNIGVPGSTGSGSQDVNRSEFLHAIQRGIYADLFILGDLTVTFTFYAMAAANMGGSGGGAGGGVSREDTGWGAAGFGAGGSGGNGGDGGVAGTSSGTGLHIWVDTTIRYKPPFLGAIEWTVSIPLVDTGSTAYPGYAGAAPVENEQATVPGTPINGSMYYPGDVARINSIIINNGLNLTIAEPADGSYVPDDWGLRVRWDDGVSNMNRRVVELNVSFCNLSGMLNINDLAELEILYCNNNNLTGLQIDSLTKLNYIDASRNRLISLVLHNKTYSYIDVRLNYMPRDVANQPTTIAGGLSLQWDVSGSNHYFMDQRAENPTVTVTNGSGSGSYRPNTEVNIAADPPETGYKFFRWNVIPAGITLVDEFAPNTSFTLSELDVVVEAVYDSLGFNEYSVTVRANNPSFGTVSADHFFGEDGETVSIAAVPHVIPEIIGYRFVEWRVIEGGVDIDNVVINVDGSQTASFVIKDEDVVIEAIFELDPDFRYKLESPANSPAGNLLKSGELVTLHISSSALAPGRRFTQWFFQEIYADGSLHIRGDTFNAQFAHGTNDVSMPVTFIMPAHPVYAGYLTRQDPLYEIIPGTHVGIAGPIRFQYAEGETVNLTTVSTYITASAYIGGDDVTWYFQRWETSANVISATTSFDAAGTPFLSLIMPAGNAAVNAIFGPDPRPIPFDLSILNAVSGITVTTTHESGEIVTITADPAPSGMIFDRWQVTSGQGDDLLGDTSAIGSNVLTSTVAMFLMPDEDVAVTANYRVLPEVQYRVIVDTAGEGFAFSDLWAAYPGDTITLSHIANEGYLFKEWQIVSGNVTIVNDQFTMPAEDVIINAVFMDPSGLASYSFISGANQSWVKGTEIDIVIVGDGELGKFLDIKVSGVIVDPDSHIRESGSTKITVKALHLETLALGEHTVEFIYIDGSAETRLFILAADGTGNNRERAPQTGVYRNILLPVIFISLGTLFITGAEIYRRHIKKSSR
jgi:hypothetical protein